MTAPAMPAAPASPGPRGVATALLDYLTVELDEAGVSVPTAQRGTPRPVALDSFPALYVEVREALDVRAGSDPGSYATTYRVRVYGFVRSGDREHPQPVGVDGFTHALDLRDDLLLSVRELLLSRPTLAGRLAPGLRPGLRESLSDLDVDDVGRTLAAFYVEVDVAVEEQLRRPPAILGHLHTGDVSTTDTVPPRASASAPPVHPAFL